jgi:hypothetical protein
MYVIDSNECRNVCYSGVHAMNCLFHNFRHSAHVSFQKSFAASGFEEMTSLHEPKKNVQKYISAPVDPITSAAPISQVTDLNQRFPTSGVD